MKSAFRLYTWRGMNVDRIDAKAVKSHAAATEFGPFTDDEQRPVHWVGWGTRENGRKIAPYFRHWPKNGRDRHLFRTLAEEMAVRDAACGESQVHKKAKAVAVDLLNRMIRESKPIPWIFSNPEVSDFPLSGDLLSEVTEAKAEYGVKTPYGDNYRFDIALVHSGGKLAKPQILGAIEFELSNVLSIWKVAVCKAMGLPIVTVDLVGLSENEISEDWLLKVLTETTKSNEEGRRRNFFFVHSMLYPLCVEIPAFVRGKRTRHGYVIFATDSDLDKLQKWLPPLRDKLGIDPKAITIQPQPNRNEQTRKTMIHEGSMAGHDWSDFNDHCYLRVTLELPVGRKGPLYLFHLIMARFLSCEVEALVGYKYIASAKNDHPDVAWWMQRVFPKPGTYADKKIIPKHLSQPIKPLKAYLSAIQVDKASEHADSEVASFE